MSGSDLNVTAYPGSLGLCVHSPNVIKVISIVTTAASTPTFPSNGHSAAEKE